MYNDFKNEFISDLTQLDLKLNGNQMNKILITLDKAAGNFDIYNKSSQRSSTKVNGIPKSVYDYISIKESEGLKKSTLYIYRVMLEIFFKNCNKPPEHVTAQDIRDFLKAYKEKKNISNRTLDKYRGYICDYFVYLHDYGVIPNNPVRQVKKIKYEVKPKAILNDYEMELMREACETRRELAMVEFFFSTACRVGELVKVKLKDIDWDEQTVLLFGKGSKYRVSFFNARCKIALQRYLETRDYDSDYLFIYDRAPWSNLTTRGVEKIIRNVADRAVNIDKKVRTHTYRRSASTMAFNRGMSLEQISSWLGHSQVATT